MEWKSIGGEKYEFFRLGEEEFEVKKGEIICKGVWIDKLPSRKKWWEMTDQTCIFIMQAVVDARLELHKQIV